MMARTAAVATARALVTVATALAIATAVQAAPSGAAPSGTAGVATSADVLARVAAMGRAMKPGQTFAWEPMLQADGSVAALEYWKAAGRPAVHPAEAEYAIVIAGAGALLSGGTLVAPQRQSAGLIDGDRIEGGSLRTLGPGDVFMVPAGMPHWFRIDGRLVLLGIKLKAATATAAQ